MSRIETLEQLRAVLGDRFRMDRASAHAGVFIRSLATPGGNEAIAPRLPTMLAILQAFGFDLSPLLARAAEFEQLAEEVRTERRFFGASGVPPRSRTVQGVILPSSARRMRWALT